MATASSKKKVWSNPDFFKDIFVVFRIGAVSLSKNYWVPSAVLVRTFT
jgi:hypothetical protein